MVNFVSYHPCAPSRVMIRNSLWCYFTKPYPVSDQAGQVCDFKGGITEVGSWHGNSALEFRFL